MAIYGRSYVRRALIGYGTTASSGVTGTVAQTTAAVTQTASGTSSAPDFTGTAAQTLPHVGQVALHVTTRFVTSVSANGRYFLDQLGNPILIHGDSPWSMLIDLSSSEMDTYLSNRAALGTNVLLCSLIGAVANGGPNDNGQTYDGVLPFVSGDITNPNSTYWSRMDSYLSKAEALGITLMIYPLDGWNTKSGCVFDGASDADCQDFGDFIATRWASRPNIIWAFGGDYDGAGDPGFADSRFDACLTGIRAAGDTRPCTIQLNFMRSNSFDRTFWDRRVDFSFGYTYFCTYEVVLTAYAKSWDTTTGKPTTRPALFCEGEYDSSPVGDNGVASTIRKQAGWALTSGSPGAFTGQERVWPFETGSPAWTTRINSTQSAQFAEILDAIRGLDKWHLLVPDTGSTLVTAGRGTPYTFSSHSDDRWNSTSDYVTAARTPDKSLAVIYIPDADNTITISTSQMGANPSATWVDPTNGATTGATWGSTFQRTTNNAAGDDDWLLILEADPVDVTGTAAQTLPPIGQSASGTVAAPGFTGTAAQTLPHVGQAASGTTAPPDFTGTAAQTLATVTQAASGTTVPPNFTGTAANVLPHVTMAASGTVVAPDFTGTSTNTLAAVTQSAAGTVDNPPGSAGTVDQTLPHVTQSSSGTTVPPAYTGTVIQTLPPITQSGTGVVEGPVTGTAAQTLPALGQAASGTVDNPPGFTGTVEQSLPPITQSGAGTFTPPAITGTAAVSVSQVGQAATGVVVAIYTGTATQTLPAVTQLAFTIPPPVVRNATARIRSNDSTARIR